MDITDMLKGLCCCLLFLLLIVLLYPVAFVLGVFFGGIAGAFSGAQATLTAALETSLKILRHLRHKTRQGGDDEPTV